MFDKHSKHCQHCSAQLNKNGLKNKGSEFAFSVEKIRYFAHSFPEIKIEARSRKGHKSQEKNFSKCNERSSSRIADLSSVDTCWKVIAFFKNNCRTKRPPSQEKNFSGQITV